MKVHHLNCATMCPRAGALVNRQRRMVCHCLLVETGAGLVLVDSGLGVDDVRQKRVSPALRAIGGFRFDEAETAVERVKALGFSPNDVTDLVLTHLDFDHAGAMPDFPRARVHVHAREHEAALARGSFFERERYHPAHWAHGPQWKLYARTGEPWNGFECVRALEGLPPEILLIPLHGHTRGHCCVAVQQGDGWLLHAGDAYFHRDTLGPAGQPSPGLKLFESIAAIDRDAIARNHARLRVMSREHPEVQVFCAHDPDEFDRHAL